MITALGGTNTAQRALVLQNPAVPTEVLTRAVNDRIGEFSRRASIAMILRHPNAAADVLRNGAQSGLAEWVESVARNPSLPADLGRVAVVHEQESYASEAGYQPRSGVNPLERASVGNRASGPSALGGGRSGRAEDRGGAGAGPAGCVASFIKADICKFL